MPSTSSVDPSNLPVDSLGSCRSTPSPGSLQGASPWPLGTLYVHTLTPWEPVGLPLDPLWPCRPTPWPSWSSNGGWSTSPPPPSTWLSWQQPTLTMFTKEIYQRDSNHSPYIFKFLRLYQSFQCLPALDHDQTRSVTKSLVTIDFCIVYRWSSMKACMWMCRIKQQFSPTKPKFDFNMLEMFFSFHCAKYDEIRWLYTKLLKTSQELRMLSRLLSVYYYCLLT